MMTMKDRAIELGLLDGGLNIAFDFAVPQPWAEDVFNRSGLWPNGVVWLYDGHAPFFGRPYAITMLGWITMKLYHLALIRSTAGSWYDALGGMPHNFSLFMPALQEREVRR
jgi:hypothetical protein